MTLYKGQHITITGAAGTVAAEVLHVETPAGLPAISGAPEVDRVRDILAEWQINELALLGGMPSHQFIVTPLRLVPYFSGRHPLGRTVYRCRAVTR